MQERVRIGVLKANASSSTAVATFGELQPVQAVQPGDPQGQLPPPNFPGQFPPQPPGQFPPGPVAPTVPTVPAQPPPPSPPAPPPFFGPGSTKPIVPGATAKPKQISIRPRSSEGLNVKTYVLPNGETVYVVSQPVIVWVKNPTNKMDVLDVEADRMVFWTRGDGKKTFDNMRGPGETSQHIELYMAGNVELRTETVVDEKTKTGKEEKKTLRCNELYYDVERNVAIALKSDLEIKHQGPRGGAHSDRPELLQLNSKIFTADQSYIDASKLPSDPGLRVFVKNTVIEEIEVPQKTIWGSPIYDKEGRPKVDKMHDVNGRNMFVYLGGIPVFYFPYLHGTVEDPLGPVESISFGVNNIFGFKAQAELNMYSLLGMEKPPDSHWHGMVDYFSERGPALGTEFDTRGKSLFGIPNTYETRIQAWGINDSGPDVLGGGRGQYAYMSRARRSSSRSTIPELARPVPRRDQHPGFADGFTFQGEVSLISDRNFLEQYYDSVVYNDLNQETFAYLKQQQDNWAWTVFGNVNTMNWFTETQWAPRPTVG